LEGIVPSPIPTHFNVTETGIENRQPDKKYCVNQSPQLENWRGDE